MTHPAWWNTPPNVETPKIGRWAGSSLRKVFVQLTYWTPGNKALLMSAPRSIMGIERDHRWDWFTWRLREGNCKVKRFKDIMLMFFFFFFSLDFHHGNGPISVYHHRFTCFINRKWGHKVKAIREDVYSIWNTPASLAEIPKRGSINSASPTLSDTANLFSMLKM